MTQLQSTPESRMWASLVHLSAFAAFVVPFGSVIAPLVIWLLKRDEMPFVDDQGKEAINFNLSIMIYALSAALLILVLIGIPLLMLVLAGWFIAVIVAAVRANEGTTYRYPLTIRFI